MANAAVTWDRRTHAPPLPRSVERLRGALLWLTGLSGAFVFMEPSPYEVVSMLSIIVFLVGGLTLRPAHLPFIALLLLYALGFAIAAIQVIDDTRAVTWVLVSWYLCATAIFFALMLGTNTAERLSLLTRGCMMAAVFSSLVGILAYFHLLGGLSELFLRFSRARGTFNDPNVLGAFLIFPALLALQRILNGGLREVFRGSMLLGLIVVALLLTFSRAAWGQFAFTAALMMFFTFVTSPSNNERLRILIIAVMGAIVLVLFVAALLSIDKIADLFQQRASLEQDYDAGHFGRFGRYTLGFQLALDRPFGIGPMQFGKIFPEDPHNTYLNTFMSGGWLSGCIYLALVLTTLIRGLRFVFVNTPWRKTYIAVYCAFVGVAGESMVIDTDHWRHYFLLLGLVWGLMIVSSRYTATSRAAPVMPAMQASA
jgi:O-antigen ligase